MNRPYFNSTGYLMISFLCFLAQSNLVSQTSSPYISKAWVSDQGDGTYKNPVLNADYSDPDVIRVGDDYYLTASSFNCVPGLPILHSKDLVNWKLANYAIKRLVPEDGFANPMHGKGVWAPCIRYHKGEFFIFWPDPDRGIYMTKTKDPLGDWEPSVMVKAGKGLIDPAPYWEEDGRVFMAHGWAKSRAGVNSIITVNELSKDASQVIGSDVLVYDGLAHGDFTIEGPKFYKRNGYYYIFAPAGSVKTGWQVILRSKNIYGPYENKIVLAQGKSTVNGPHQGAWVDTPNGESWFLHFQDKEIYGRVMHLQPMAWVNDWPVMGVDTDGDGCGDPVLYYKKPNVGKVYPIETPAESDEFNDEKLGLQWQWHANPKHYWGMNSRLGFLRLNAEFVPQDFVNLWSVPNLLLQKTPADEFMVTSKLLLQSETPGEKGGLVMMGIDYSSLSLVKTATGFEVQQIVCVDSEKLTPEKLIVQKEISQNEIYLRIQVKNKGLCSFSYSLDGRMFTSIGNTFTARQGKWIGTKVGLFCLNPLQMGPRGHADLDWFRVEK